jgi:HK97 family phage prohead protease
MTIQRKFFPFATKSEGLGERQVRVVISTAGMDRAGDIVVPGGIDLTAYKSNPVVLWQHDPNCPSARCLEIAVKGGDVEALVQFPPEGDDPDADKLYRRIKNGVVNAASIGFNPTQAEPIKGAGLKFVASELMEFSFVTIPCNADALIVARALKTKDAKPMKVKGLYDVAQLAYLLSSLGYLEDNAEWEAEYEGDNSPVPAMLHDALRQLGAALVAMTQEEVSELLGEEGATDKAAAVARIKTFRRILKAGRALSSANETDIKAACELMETASDKLSGVLETVKSELDDESDGGDAEEKAADADYFRFRARAAEVLASI